jgi:hypothetical protein
LGKKEVVDGTTWIDVKFENRVDTSARNWENNLVKANHFSDFNGK